MLLGTLPIIVLIAPCVLAGACLLIPQLAALSTAVAMLAVVAYVLQEFAATNSGIPEPVVSLSYGLFHPFV